MKIERKRLVPDAQWESVTENHFVEFMKIRNLDAGRYIRELQSGRTIKTMSFEYRARVK